MDKKSILKKSSKQSSVITCLSKQGWNTNNAGWKNPVSQHNQDLFTEFTSQRPEGIPGPTALCVCVTFSALVSKTSGRRGRYDGKTQQIKRHGSLKVKKKTKEKKKEKTG